MINKFESEFPQEAMPEITGAPMQNSLLNERATESNAWIRIERAQQNVPLKAVEGFYLAKYFSQEIADVTDWPNQTAKFLTAELEDRLWRLAVIDIAIINDHNRGIVVERQASLPTVLKSMETALQESNDSTAKEDLKTIKELKSSINPEVHVSLRYVRHVRNKWAAHPSMDRAFDDWADADKYLNVPLLEDALARLIRAHQHTAKLVDSSTILGPLFSTPQPKPKTTESPKGAKSSTPLSIYWGNVTLWAQVVRENAQKEASILCKQIASSPNGSSTDKSI